MDKGKSMSVLKRGFQESAHGGWGSGEQCRAAGAKEREWVGAATWARRGIYVYVCI